MNFVQLKTIQQNFVKELKDANAGKKTSLPFIIHDLSPSTIVKNGEVFQVFVVGGTVGKVVILKKTKDGIRILEKKDEKLEFKDGEDFLSFINKELDPSADRLALNLAYPIKPVFEKGRLDGVLLAVTKEGSFHGLVGKKVGLEIEKYIFEKRKKRITVSVANDTICLLLSGLVKYRWDKLAAGIVGTGLNFGFFLNKGKAVNLESASFDKFPQSQEGKVIDQQSAKPGRALFEKETAGAYLYKHFNLIIKEKKIKYPQISSTEELNALCHPEFISGSKNNRREMLKLVQHDRVDVSGIAQGLLKHSAQLVGCQIAGITAFKKGRRSGKVDTSTDSRIPQDDERFWTRRVPDGNPSSQNDKKDEYMVFNMEGSLFWKGNQYKETVMETVRQLVVNHSVRFVEIEDSAILGSARLIS